jgi:peptidoglycan/xylan/chitin deacetylase (PgdA/CDA1 family)
MTPKAIVKACLATMWGQRLLHLRSARARVVVLTYHRITSPAEPFDGTGVEQFRRHMRWLKTHCRTLRPQELDEAVSEPPRRQATVLVTFDDGYRSHYSSAYPILDELQIPHVVFLATRFMDEGGMIWTDEVSYMVRRTRCREVCLPWDRGERVALESPVARRRVEALCKAHLKRVPDQQRRQLQQALGRLLGVELARDALPRQMLDWNEIRAMSALACYGGHTHSHPILSQLPPEQARQEIGLCSERIAQETGVRPVLFAYPNGQRSDYTEDNQQALRNCGFSHAFTTMGGVYSAGMDRYAIRRQPTGCTTLGDFAWLAGGR